ncbi:MAG: HEAT repeat domain-containing protein [Polyangiaceae bacterium]|nr:HEAT repeat domain-containing protein [Polyangiaceae bacterium]
MRLPLLGWILAGFLAAGSAQAFVWPNQIDRIERQLRDDDLATRRGAAQRIAELPAGIAAKLALQALVDADAEVRLAAVEVAIRRAPAGAVPILVPWLSDPDDRLRVAAARALAVVPDERAIGVLGRVLADPNVDVREAAARALGSAGRPEATRLLLGHLDDSVPRIREVIVDALARLGDRSAVVPLLGKAQDPAGPVRRRVVRALGELGDDRAVSTLLLVIQDADETVRGEALAALGRLRATSAVPSIVAALETEEDGLVRRHAVAALASLGSDAAVAALVAALDEPGPGLDRDDLAELLGSVGDRAVPELERCLGGQPAANVARGCAQALATVGGAHAASAVTGALRRGVLEPAAALAALGRAGDPSALPTVLEFLADPDPAARVAAGDAAGLLLDPRQPDGRAVVPVARALAKTHQREDRRRLVRLLGRTGAPSAIPVLEPLVRKNEDLALRLAVVAALGEIEPAGQDRALLELLDDADGSTRWAAAVALFRCASGAAARTLVDQLEVAAARDRVALSVALGGALSRNRDPSLLVRVAELARRTRGGERDALLEALGRSPLKEAARLVAGFGTPADSVPDRAKVAEALAAHPAGIETLRRLAADPDGAVRANAVWALGTVGTAADARQIAAALADADIAVAGNAAGALGRLAKRTRADVKSALCSALEAPRAYVRANAGVAASLLGERCDPMVARRLVSGDESPLVRRAAAWLLLRTPAADAHADAIALERCAEHDREGAVAVVCAAAAPPLPVATDPVAVYVVPAAESGPVARAPFSLVLADGILRLGVTDRRGVVFEAAAPRGGLSLEVPAPLAQ